MRQNSIQSFALAKQAANISAKETLETLAKQLKESLAFCQKKKTYLDI